MAQVVCKSGLCIGRDGLGRVAFALLCATEGILDCLGENCWEIMVMTGDTDVYGHMGEHGNCSRWYSLAQFLELGLVYK